MSSGTEKNRSDSSAGTAFSKSIEDVTLKSNAIKQMARLLKSKLGLQSLRSAAPKISTTTSKKSRNESMRSKRRSKKKRRSSDRRSRNKPSRNSRRSSARRSRGKMRLSSKPKRSSHRGSSSRRRSKISDQQPLPLPAKRRSSSRAAPPTLITIKPQATVGSEKVTAETPTLPEGSASHSLQHDTTSPMGAQPKASVPHITQSPMTEHHLHSPIPSPASESNQVIISNREPVDPPELKLRRHSLHTSATPVPGTDIDKSIPIQGRQASSPSNVTLNQQFVFAERAAFVPVRPGEIFGNQLLPQPGVPAGALGEPLDHTVAVPKQADQLRHDPTPTNRQPQYVVSSGGTTYRYTHRYMMPLQYNQAMQQSPEQMPPQQQPNLNNVPETQQPLLIQNPEPSYQQPQQPMLVSNQPQSILIPNQEPQQYQQQIVSGSGVPCFRITGAENREVFCQEVVSSQQGCPCPCQQTLMANNPPEWQRIQNSYYSRPCQQTMLSPGLPPEQGLQTEAPLRHQIVSSAIAVPRYEEDTVNQLSGYENGMANQAVRGNPIPLIYDGGSIYCGQPKHVNFSRQSKHVMPPGYPTTPSLSSASNYHVTTTTTKRISLFAPKDMHNVNFPGVDRMALSKVPKLHAAKVTSRVRVGQFMCPNCHHPMVSHRTRTSTCPDGVDNSQQSSPNKS